MDLCDVVNFLIIDFLVTQILAKWWTPRSHRQSQKSQSSLLAMLISSSADFFDLLDYSNLPEIAEVIGVDFIYSEFYNNHEFHLIFKI